MSEVTENTTTSTETTVAGEPQQKPEWNKDKQRADQAEAAARRLKAEKDELASKVTDNEQKLTDLQAKLDQIASANEVDVDNLDPSLTDPGVLKAIKKLKDRISSLTAVEAKVSKYEAELLADRQKQAEAKRQEKILAPLDKEYGVNFRNKALEMARAEFDTLPADVRSDWSEVDGARLIEKQYKILKSEEESSKKKSASVTTDTGGGAVATSSGPAIKSGKLSDVVANIRKHGISGLTKT